jgi:hypothetical protein
VGLVSTTLADFLAKWNGANRGEHMKDPETQAVLNRITQANLRVVVWMWCAAGTFLAVEQIVAHWSRWPWHGKIMASVLLVFLALFPTQLILLTKKNKPIQVSWVIMMAYMLLFFAVMTFASVSLVR